MIAWLRFCLTCLVVVPLVQPSASGSMVTVIVELDTAPAVVRYASERMYGEPRARISARSRVEELERTQRQLGMEIDRLHGVVIARMQRTYNGMIVLVPLRHLASLRSLDGIRSVAPAPRYALSNARSVPSIGAPAAWTFADGLTGRRQKIAIVDTGLDYTHADFGGAGTAAAFEAARKNTAVVEPGSGFPSVKVPGGIDLAGDAYNADNAATAIPAPDPDPLDCYGHGTHVAGTAGGYGVGADGRTYRGPYDAATPFGSLRIGPGVAPEAHLYPVKIFGCSGSTVLTPAAIEWAVDPNGDGDFSDRMDVVNLSIGSASGSGYDASTVAANNAGLAGVVVVTSAGNDGDTTFATSTPGSADRAISVAAGSGSQIAGFSSRGPRRGDVALKPDLAAPGTGIYSAGLGQGAGGTFLSGTSMASPHVAGAAALVRQRFPDWTVEMVKAALLNTTTSPFRGENDEPYSLLRTGSGQVDIGRAVRTNAVAFAAEDAGRVSLSFGALEVVDRLSAIRNVRVVNDGDAGQTFAIAARATLPAAGVTVRPLLGTVTLAPGASATVPVLLDIPDARQLIPAFDPTMMPLALGERRHRLGEIVGAVTFTPTDAAAQPLQVPYFATARRAALVTAVEQHDGDAPLGDLTLRFRGTTTLTTTLASVYELQHRSPKRLPSPTEQPGVLELGEAADLENVGVASDYSASRGVDQSTVSFGISTYSPWSTPSELAVVVLIDTNRDGAPDYRLRTLDGGPLGVGGVGDAHVIEVSDLQTGRVQRVGRLNFVGPELQSGLYGGRVMGFAVRAADIGLSSARTRFDYRVETSHLDVVDAMGEAVVVDRTPVLSYDMARPGFRTTDGASAAAGTPLRGVDAVPVVVPYDTENIARNRGLGLLVLHHTNIATAQAQALPLTLQRRRQPVYLPLVQQR